MTTPQQRKELLEKSDRLHQHRRDRLQFSGCDVVATERLGDHVFEFNVKAGLLVRDIILDLHEAQAEIASIHAAQRESREWDRADYEHSCTCPHCTQHRENVAKNS